MDLNEAISIVGSNLGTASKVPGFTLGLAAKDCITGAKLREVPGSVCSKCYAFRGNYTYSQIKAAQERRLIGITNPNWIEAMVFLIQNQLNSKKKKKNHDGSVSVYKTDARYFRWHDSGDLQSIEHMEKIAEIARQLPQVSFWLPTREFNIVKDWFALGNQCPTNLTIRLSAHIINGPLPTNLATQLGVQVSGVYDHTNPIPKGIKECRAYTRKAHCGRCRACWNKNVMAVVYPLH